MAINMVHGEQCDAQLLQLTRLWSRAQPIVGAMVVGAVFDFHDAEDVVAEVAETVVRNFDQYDPGRPFVSWVLGITRKLLLRYYERQATQRHVYFDEGSLQLMEAAYVEIADEIPVRHAALRECLAAIRDHHRLAFKHQGLDAKLTGVEPAHVLDNIIG